MVDFIFAIIEHFSLSLNGSDVISRYWPKSAFFKGVGHFKRKFQVEGGITHQPPLVSENQNDYPFMWCQNFSCMFFRFVIKHASVRQADRQTHRTTIPKTALAYLLRAVESEQELQKLWCKIKWHFSVHM